jgi:hypothetical protein
MTDRVATLLAYSLGTVMLVGTSIGAWWFLLKGVGSQRHVKERYSQIVAREAAALRLFAARVGAPHEPASARDAWGNPAPAPGSVVHTCHNLVARVGYAQSDTSPANVRDEPKYLPQVLIEVPPGMKWGVTLDAIDGSRVRKSIAAGKTVGDAFRVRRGDVPPSAHAPLRYVGAHVFSLELSPSQMDARMWPDDMTKYPVPLSAMWDGGYDIEALVEFVEQTCSVASALLVPDTAL